MSVFDRIVCGVDPSSDAGLEALRQSARLLAPAGALTAVTVHDPAGVSRAGWQAPAIEAELARAAGAAQTEASRMLEGLPGAEAVLVTGSVSQRLFSVAVQESATLLAVGWHGSGRATGILLGSVATKVLHDAPCAVLVARTAPDGDAFPRTIVGGADGSAHSLAAVEAGVELAERLGAGLRIVAATGGRPVDTDGLLGVRSLEPRLLAGTAAGRAPARVPLLEWDERSPVDSLVAASAAADLVVLGSRGLHGLASLGSVSERVAHRAACSVLVVR